MTNHSWTNSSKESLSVSHDKPLQNKQVKRIIIKQSWQTSPEQTGQKNHCQSVMTNHSRTNRPKESLSVSHDKPLQNKQVKRIIVCQSWPTTPEQTGQKNLCQSVMPNHSWTNRSNESLSASHYKPPRTKQFKRIIVSQSWQTTPEQIGQKNRCQSVMTNHSWTNRSKESLSVSHDKPLLSKQVKRIFVSQLCQTTPEQTGQKNHCQSVMPNHSWTNRSKESLSLSHSKPLLTKQVKRIIVSQSLQTTPDQTDQKNHCRSVMTNHSWANRSKETLSISHDKPLLNKQVKRIIVSQSRQTTPEQTGQKNLCQSVMPNHSWTNRSNESLSASHYKPPRTKQFKRIIVSQSWPNHSWTNRSKESLSVSHDKPLLDQQVKRIIVSQPWQTTPEQTGQKNLCQSVMPNHSWTNRSKESLSVSHAKPLLNKQVKRVIVSQSFQTTPDQTGQKDHCQSVITNHSWPNRSKESLSVSHDKPLLSKQVKRNIVNQSWQTSPEQTGQKNHCQSVTTNDSRTNRSKESLSVSHYKPPLTKQVKRIIVDQSWQTSPEQTGQKNHCQSVITNHSRTNRSKESLSVSHYEPLLNKQVNRIIVSQSWQTTPEPTGQKNHCQSVITNHSRTNRSKESLSVSHDKPLQNKQVKRIIINQSWQTSPEPPGQNNHCQSVMTNYTKTNMSKESLSVSHDKPLLNHQVKRIIVNQSWQTTPKQTGQKNHCQSVILNHSLINRSKESLSVSHEKPLLNKQVKRIIVSQPW